MHLKTLVTLSACGLLLAVVSLIGCGAGEDAASPPALIPGAQAAPWFKAGVGLRLEDTGKLSGDWAGQDPLRLSLAGTDAEQLAALTALGDRLVTVVGRVAPNASDGLLNKPLGLDVDPATAWRHVLWVIQVAADPRVGIHEVWLRPRGGTTWTRLDLPRDSGMSDSGPLLGDLHLAEEYRKVKLALYRKEQGTDNEHTKVILDNKKSFLFPTGATPGGPEFEAVLQQLRQAVKKRLDEWKPVVVELAASPPDGPGTPFEDALAMIRLVHALGHGAVFLEGTHMPWVPGD